MYTDSSSPAGLTNRSATPLGARSQLSEDTPLLQASPEKIPRHIYLTELGLYYGFRFFHIWLLFAAPLSQLPAACIIGTSPYLLSSIQDEFAVSDDKASLIHTGVLLGSLPGVVLCGRMCDKFGRKSTIMACAALITGLNLLCLLIPRKDSGGFAYLVALRILLGFPYGGLLTLVLPYLIEFVCDRMRGALAVLIGLTWSFGVLFAISMVGYFGTESWRECFALTPIIPCSVSLLAVSTLPESPRWLRVARTPERAQLALDTVFASQPVLGTAYVGKAPEVQMQETDDKEEDVWNFRGVLKELFGPQLLQITIITSLTYAVVASCGNTMSTWSPRILELVSGKEPGLTIFSHGEVLSQIVLVVTALTVDFVGRRFYIWSCFLLIISSLAALSAVTTLASAKAVWLTFHGGSTALWATLTAYMTEAFPTSVRGSAVGMTMVLGRLLSVLLPMLVGWLFNATSIDAILLGFAACYLVGFLVSLFIPEETARHPTMDKCMDRADVSGLRSESVRSAANGDAP